MWTSFADDGRSAVGSVVAGTPAAEADRPASAAPRRPLRRRTPEGRPVVPRDPRPACRAGSRAGPWSCTTTAAGSRSCSARPPDGRVRCRRRRPTVAGPSPRTTSGHVDGLGHRPRDRPVVAARGARPVTPGASTALAVDAGRPHGGHGLRRRHRHLLGRVARRRVRDPRARGSATGGSPTPAAVRRARRAGRRAHAPGAEDGWAPRARRCRRPSSTPGPGRSWTRSTVGRTLARTPQRVLGGGEPRPSTWSPSPTGTGPSCSTPRRARRWPASSSTTSRSSDERHPDRVWSTAWTPDGDHLLLGAEGKAVGPRRRGPRRRGHRHLAGARPSGSTSAGAAQTMEVSPDEQRARRRHDRSRRSTTPQPGIVQLLDANTFEADERELRMGTGDHPYRPLLLAGRLAPGGGDRARASCTSSTPAPGSVLHDAEEGARRLASTRWSGFADARTVVSTGEDGMISLYDSAPWSRPRAPCPASADLAQDYTYLLSLSRRTPRSPP